jgi:Bacterial Ig domain
MSLRLVTTVATSLVLAALAAPGAAQTTSPPRSRILRWIPAPRRATSAAPSNIIFLNNCVAANSCNLTPGLDQNDSRTNVSSVATQPVILEPFRHSPAQWNALVQCVQQVYAPFNVQIVTTEPPASTEYFEAMVAGKASQLGIGGGIVGVAPFTCGVIPNAITFSFANDYPDLGASNAADLCWTVAQEIAHAFGLQHKFDARDPMTYLPPALPQKLFLNEDGPCGTNAARDCTRGDLNELKGCPGAATMNSYRQIAALFGEKPGTPPQLTVSQPADGAEVSRGFLVRATASDDVRLRDVAVSLDGVRVGPALRAPPFDVRTAKTTPAGDHALEIVATDFYGATTRVSRAIAVKADCTGTATGCDSGELCLDGRCIAGPKQPGGLGTTCSGNAECASGACAASGADRYCVEECVVGSGSCPGGFSCLAAAGSGVCWPKSDSGGCDAGRSGDSLPITLGLGFAILVLAPRSRRRRAA